MVAETSRTIPEDLIALKEGTPVFSADKERVGNVKRLITDPDRRQVTHFTIDKGLLLRKSKLIPFEWVDVLSEEGVSLAVDSQEIKDLPEFQE